MWAGNYYKQFIKSYCVSEVLLLVVKSGTSTASTAINITIATNIKNNTDLSSSE